MGKGKRDGFYKRGRFWWTRDPETGQRCSTGCTDREAAARWRAARERIAADPAHAAAQTSRLGEWIGRWLTTKERKASPSTMNVARTKLGHWVRLVGQETPLSAITPGAVDQYVASRRAEEVTDHTISKELTHLLSVLRLAKRGGCFAGDIDALRPPDLHAGYVPRKRALTRPDLAALLSELEPHHGALVAVCVALGCRLSEAMRLLPTDVESDRVLIRGTKSKGAQRYVPILSLYRPLLERALPHVPLQRWDNVRRGLARACRRAGIDTCTPNDLRRTHSTLLIEAGVDRDVVRRLLGHTTTAMVDRVYGQPTIEALSSLAETKLLSAAPVQLRHNVDPGVSREISDSAGNPGANSEIRTPDLRFTKPNQDICHLSQNGYTDSKHAGLTHGNIGESAPKLLSAGTSTSQSVERLSLSLEAWQLLRAAERVGVVACPGRPL